MIHVLIADDSAFMRKVLSDLFAQQADFEVVGVAFNGKDAVEKVLKLKPDLLTMDVNMPIMNGLEALEVIMKDCPLPVVMLSSLTKEGADATIQALSLGAVDFLSKTGGSISKIDSIAPEILEKCRAAAKANVRWRSPVAEPLKPVAVKAEMPPVLKHIEVPKRTGLQLKPKVPVMKHERGSVHTSLHTNSEKTPVFKPVIKTYPAPPKHPVPVCTGGFVSGSRKLVAIGTSTGGPKALQNVITRLPGNLPCGVVIVQHMPAGFTKSLAERLDTISEISVKEAENHDIIEAGHVYIAPGNYHMTVQPNGTTKMIVLNQDPPLASHRPAVDILFESVVQFGQDVVSVILTGMGCDGSAGMKKIKKAGGYIIAEDESTSVVYGMPKAVVDLGLADEVLPVQNVAKAIVEAVKK